MSNDVTFILETTDSESTSLDCLAEPDCETDSIDLKEEETTALVQHTSSESTVESTAKGIAHMSTASVTMPPPPTMPKQTTTATTPGSSNIHKGMTQPNGGMTHPNMMTHQPNHSMTNQSINYPNQTMTSQAAIAAQQQAFYQQQMLAQVLLTTMTLL